MLVASLLNCSLTFFFAEIASRTGLGEGLLDLTVYEVSDWLIVNPSNFSEGKAIDIKNAFQSICSQNAKSIDKETKDHNRNLLNELILQSIDLDIQGIEEIHFELNRMVSNRLNRANTF
jgi:glycerol dehydrogenase-like iron-containing ADH family enzyme